MRAGRSSCVIVTQALLGLAIVFLVVLNLSPRAPIQQIAVGPLPQTITADQLEAQDREVSNVAQGGNLAMHFAGFDPKSFRQSLLMSQLYFRAAYSQYPRRVFVGRGGEIINTGADLAASDVLPDDAWLRQHDVRGVLTLRLGRDGDVRADTRAIPQN